MNLTFIWRALDHPRDDPRAVVSDVQQFDVRQLFFRRIFFDEIVQRRCVQFHGVVQVRGVDRNEL